MEAEAGGSEWFYPEGRAPPFSAGPGAPGSSSQAMAFTFAAFCYMLALLLTAALIFFAIWHVSSRGRGERGRATAQPLAAPGPGLRGAPAAGARQDVAGLLGPWTLRAPGPGVRRAWRAGSRCPRRRVRAQAALRYSRAGLGGAGRRAAPWLRRARADALSASPVSEDAQCAPSGGSRREVFLIFILELPISF